MYDARILFAGLILSLTTGSAAAVTIYQCEDEKGNRTYESTCPPGTKNVEKRDYATDGARAAEGDQAELLPVTMYVVPDCDACTQIKEFLSVHQIPYTTKDVKDDVALQGELKKIAGELRAPTVLVGEKAIVGYNRAALIAALKESGYLTEEDITEDARAAAAAAAAAGELAAPAPAP